MGRDKKKQYNRIYAQNSSSINSLKRQQVYPASATNKLQNHIFGLAAFSFLSVSLSHLVFPCPGKVAR